MDASSASKPTCTSESSSCCCGGVRDVLNWKNPVTTGCVFGAINVYFFLFAVMDYSALSLLFHAALFFMAAGFLVSVFVTKSASESESIEVFTRQQVEDGVLFAYDRVNDIASYVRRIVLWQDTKSSGKCVAALFASIWISSWISFTTLAFLFTWYTFTRVYTSEWYAVHIAPTLRPHIAAATKALTNLYSKIPRMAADKKIA